MTLESRHFERSTHVAIRAQFLGRWGLRCKRVKLGNCLESVSVVHSWLRYTVFHINADNPYYGSSWSKMTLRLLGMKLTSHRTIGMTLCIGNRIPKRCSCTQKLKPTLSNEPLGPFKIPTIGNALGLRRGPIENDGPDVPCQVVQRAFRSKFTPGIIPKLVEKTIFNKHKTGQRNGPNVGSSAFFVAHREIAVLVLAQLYVTDAVKNGFEIFEQYCRVQ